MILDDPELRARSRTGIRPSRNAEFVFRDYMSSDRRPARTVEDEYLRERRADLLDVERRVLRYWWAAASAVVLPDQPSVLVAHDIGPSEVALLDRRGCWAW
jgi:phosphoenolpyruvate-protein kinase (PTS system EI component)